MSVWQWTHGTRDPENVDPDLPALDTLGFDRPGNRDVQVQLRDHQPSTLIVWGENNEIFGADGARAYLKDLPDAETAG
jgi:hypothetical protein